MLGNGKTTTNTYNKGFPLTTSTPGVQNLSYNFQLTTGNLLQRNDILKNQQEVFTYDNLNRLLSSTVNSVQQFGITYDGTSGNTMGNIASKTDAGYYKYKSDKIHAVAYTMNQPTPGQSAVTPAPVSAVSNAEQLITYTPFSKTASIGEGCAQLTFTYGPDYVRVKTQLVLDNWTVETKYFMGNYEKKVTFYNSSEIHYVSGGNGICAIVTKADGVVTPYTVYTDHLGSIIATTNAAGTAVYEQNFDAWGRKRNPANWNSFVASPLVTCGGGPDIGDPVTEPTNDLYEEPAPWMYRGFTGHEMLPYFNLINMNGRIYDPILGRMLSPDNFVNTPYGTQGYNRYGYAMNNPLKYVDPDGNFPWLAVAAIAAVNGFVKGIQYTESGQGSFLGGFWRGALIGGAGAAAGVLAPIGILPGLAYGVGVGAALGGISNSLDGQNFWKGAFKGGIIGGISGGIIGGIEADKLGANIWTGQRPAHYLLASQLPKVNGSGPAPYTDEYLHKLYNQNFGRTNGMTWMSTEYMPANALHQADGTWLIDGESVVAITRPYVWSHGKLSKIYFSRAAFQSKEYLSVTMAHELGHVTHNYLGLSKLAKEKLDMPSKLLDNEGHLAIQKMTYNFIQKNGWVPSAFNVQSAEIFRMRLADQYLYDPISFLIKKIVFPK